MNKMYFYIKNGQQYGPVNYKQLESNNLSPDTPVWCYGMKSWTPFKDLSSNFGQSNNRRGFINFRVWLAQKISPVAYSEPYVDMPIKKEKKKLSANLKRTIKILIILLISLLIIAGLSIGGYYGYNYYQHIYLPQKYLNEACVDLESKWINGTDEEKYSIAKNILTNNPSWNYPYVSDNSICAKFAIPKRREAFQYIEDKAFSGIDKFQYLLGQLYSNDDIYCVSQDYTKAAYWWNQAAQSGHSRALGNLGWAYLYGKGVNMDKEKAFYYFQIAANLDNPFAIYNLGNLYESGIKTRIGTHYEYYRTYKTEPDYSGDIFVRSGWNGIGYYKDYKHKVVDYRTYLNKDLNKAIELWKKAAELGYGPAKEKLQQIYEE